jgi:signal peptidase I
MKRVQSYEDTRRRRSRLLQILKYVALFFVVFEVFSAFAFKTWVVSSSSMQPTLEARDRIVIGSSSYGILNPFSGKRASFKAPSHGDVVLLRLPSSKERSWYQRLLDSLVRFLTFQSFGQPGAHLSLDNPVIKRIVATPGDSVMLDGFIVYVKTRGTSHYLTEYEVSGANYDINSIQPIKDWGKDMPLSGTMAPVELGPGEFFVVGDNRFSSGDSRFFGPVKSGLVIGKVLFRYWPFDQMAGF